MSAVLLMALTVSSPAVAASASHREAISQLAEEVKSKGWIVYGARSMAGDWDLFRMRPDGSEVHPVTRSPEQNEFSPQFSRDGKRLLYRRIPRDETIDNNHHGTQGELMLSHSDGSQAVAVGGPGEYPWASWSPDGTQIACLSIQGIALVEAATRQVVRSWPRKGFFQQLVWSPDGQWLIGVANSYGASWSIARMEVATGEARAVNRVDCCTPDWFPDSQRVVFSWRPPGQEANDGYGWTQLWMAQTDGPSRQLIYGEDGRHVYGGHVSPDGRYVLFTGNMREDGDPGNAGGPMGLMRLSDAPLLGGESRALRLLHPNVKDGPVLALPAGWEPCWTFASPWEDSATSRAHPGTPTLSNDRSVDVANLAAELRGQGWLVFSAPSGAGDWDLFLMRPDGSNRRRITNTPPWNEAGARFSPDGKRLLYFRMPSREPVDNNTYGTFELVMAEADARNPVSWGRDYPWATWGPEGRRLACLKPRGIEVVDVENRSVLQTWPRHGLVAQLVWSPDGLFLAGTANGLGPYWNIGCLSAVTGEIHLVSENDRYNCTPDWQPDATSVLYARGIIPEEGGHAELWRAAAQGKEHQPLYAEANRHIYGACASPNGHYILFTRSVEDLGKVDQTGTTMAIIRRRDTPMIGTESPRLRQRLPRAAPGPRLDLGPGWEPHWTAREVVP